jgi:hypothetical protein
MTPFDPSFSASSPILAVPPRQPHAASFAPESVSPKHTPSYFDLGATSIETLPTNHHQPISASSSSARKRSRDEASANLDTDTSSAPPCEEQWIFGEGTVLSKPGINYVTDTSRQTRTGMWAEEVPSSNTPAHRGSTVEGPVLKSRKSMRIGPASEITTQSIASNSPQSQTPNFSRSHSHRGDNPDLVVDEFTIQLGIGWRRISDDEHIQAAARGWARYIENHFPLSSVQIRLESKGLQSYLVEAAEGFFLFAEDLRKGQLVSSTAQGTLHNLRQPQPVFEGSHIMSAAESPQPGVAALPGTAATDTVMRE